MAAGSQLRIAVAGVLAAQLMLTGAGPARAGSAEVSLVAGRQFVPKEVSIRAGDTVVWSHRDGSVPHTVTADDGSFDSHPRCARGAETACMREPDTFAQPFSQPGRFPYFCRIHGGPGGRGMAGVVVVSSTS